MSDSENELNVGDSPRVTPRALGQPTNYECPGCGETVNGLEYHACSNGQVRHAFHEDDPTTSGDGLCDFAYQDGDRCGQPYHAPVHLRHDGVSATLTTDEVADYRIAHRFTPGVVRADGSCIVLVDGSPCGEPEDAPVHGESVEGVVRETERPPPPPPPRLPEASEVAEGGVSLESASVEADGETDDYPNLSAEVTEMLRWFEYRHLSPELQDVARPFSLLARCLGVRAEWQVEELDEASDLSTRLGLLASADLRGPELAVALRKLLEAKDAAVRARIAKIREAQP